MNVFLRPSARRNLVAEELRRDPSRSNRQIASLAGVHHETAAAVRAELETSGEIRQLEKTVGGDGRRRRARVQADPWVLPAGIHTGGLLDLPQAGQYRIVYADPPWEYRDRKGGDPALCGYTYPPMTLEDISALPVAKIVQRPAALLLWVTAQHLAEGAHVRVAQAWGFELVTKAFCWVKLNPSVPPEKVAELNATQDVGGDLKSGCGHWVNGNTEDCFIGFTKGRRPERLSKKVKQLVFWPVSDHSAKPPLVRGRIEALLGDLPRVELFARQTASGWDGWGRDYPGGGA
ncbi:MAG: MT-A70 family methyltransferase [Candidatus Xenobia bacterium]